MARKKSPRSPPPWAPIRRSSPTARANCRVQSDARLPRLPHRHRLSGNRRDAGARDLRGRGRSRQAHRQAGGAGSDGAADRDQGGVRSGQGAHRRHGAGGGEGNRRQAQLSGRHHDRIAARRADGRRDRRDGGVLLLRHQRSHADHLRHFARRRRELPRHLYGARHPAGRSLRLDRPAGRRRTGAHRRRARAQGAAEAEGRASAASTAAIRPRSPSSTRPSSITCPARRSACRSRGLAAAQAALGKAPASQA